MLREVPGSNPGSNANLLFMQVKLKTYTTEQCPICPWDEINGPLAVNKIYTVLGLNPIEYEGTTYQVYSLERTNPADPGPGMYWPKFATIIV
jgi:hypothetical protein